MKYTKELKAGFFSVLAIVTIILGVNFLKGNSFFGGDQIFYSYFENSAQLQPASNVTLNGVTVGKVISVEYSPNISTKNRVKVTFSIQEKNIVLPMGTVIEIGSLDLLNKGLLIVSVFLH